MPIKSMQDIAQWIADMAFDKPVNFPLVQQMGEEQGILQTTARFPNVATVLFIPASNEITCGTFCLSIAKGAAESESGGLMTYADQTPIQRQKDEKEIAVMQTIYDYDKENIVGVWVALEDSDNGIVSANIMVVSKNGIADANEQDKLEAIASGYLNLDARDISLLFMDSETFFAQGKE